MLAIDRALELLGPSLVAGRALGSKEGFELIFTQPLDPATASDPASYGMDAWTYIYQKGYGSPEVDQTTPTVSKAIISADGFSVHLVVEGRVKGHVHDFGLDAIRSAEGQPLVHPMAYYTLNEIPSE